MSEKGDRAGRTLELRAGPAFHLCPSGVPFLCSNASNRTPLPHLLFSSGDLYKKTDTY